MIETGVTGAESDIMYLSWSWVTAGLDSRHHHTDGQDLSIIYFNQSILHCLASYNPSQTSLGFQFPVLRKRNDSFHNTDTRSIKTEKHDQSHYICMR